MHLWLNKSIIKSSKSYSSKVLSLVPKGTSAADWQKYVKEFKNDKLLMLDRLPKPSKAAPRKDKAND